MMNQMEVVLYTKDKSFACWRAKRLLERRGYALEVRNLTNGSQENSGARVDRTISEKRVPFLFIDGRPVGREIMALGASGTLDWLVRGEV
jgi:glutaredoxin